MSSGLLTFATSEARLVVALCNFEPLQIPCFADAPGFDPVSGTGCSTARSTRWEEAVTLMSSRSFPLVPENGSAMPKLSGRQPVKVAVARLAGALESRGLRAMSDFSAQSKKQATAVALVSPLSHACVVARVKLSKPVV